MNNLWFTLLTIILFGVVGGLINKIRDNDKTASYLKSIIKGIGAALLVPLFLELVKSEIVQSGSENWYNYFVFGGLCLIAAIFSDKFFNSLAKQLIDKVENAENTANEAKEKVKEMEDDSTEQDLSEDVIFENLKEDADDDFKQKISLIVKAIVNSRYAYRTIGGIAKEVQLDKMEVINILVTLEGKGMARRKKNKHGNDIWKIIIK